MSKLKNGKELSEALKEVAVYKKKSKALKEKYGYYQKSEYYERLCEVFGIDGFAANYEFCGLHTLPTNQIFGVGKCVIGLLDENENIVYSVSGIGTEEIEFSEKNEKYIMLNNVGSGVDTAAFKEACRQMNIFNCVMEKKQGGNNSSEQTQPAATVEHKLFLLKGNLIENGKCRFTEKTVYKQKAVCDGVETEIMFYPNQYTKEKNWDTFFQRASLGQLSEANISCEKARNGSGYIFKSFVVKGA